MSDLRTKTAMGVDKIANITASGDDSAAPVSGSPENMSGAAEEGGRNSLSGLTSPAPAYLTTRGPSLQLPINPTTHYDGKCKHCEENQCLCLQSATSELPTPPEFQTSLNALPEGTRIGFCRHCVINNCRCLRNTRLAKRHAAESLTTAAAAEASDAASAAAIHDGDTGTETDAYQPKTGETTPPARPRSLVMRPPPGYENPSGNPYYQPEALDGYYDNHYPDGGAHSRRRTGAHHMHPMGFDGVQNNHGPGGYQYQDHEGQGQDEGHPRRGWLARAVLFARRLYAAEHDLILCLGVAGLTALVMAIVVALYWYIRKSRDGQS